MGTPIPEPSSFYTPLEDLSRSLRLIEFCEPPDLDDTFPSIRCKLIRASFDDPAGPEYDALSYCWGDAGITVPILINGVVHHITANLAAALRTIRDQQDTAIPIWADAICINQHDLAEKACQVNMMALIFSRARRCLIWLGDTYDPPDSEHPMHASDPNTITNNDAMRAFGLIQSLAQDEHYSMWRSGQGVGDLAPLINLPWWHRIWMVQETALPHERIVICGSLQLPWTTLVTAARNFQKHHHKSCCARAVSSLKSFRDKVDQLERARDVATVGTLFQLFRDRGATDLRDKVFGLLALHAWDVRANYQATLKSVLTHTTRKIIAQAGTLKVLLRTKEYERNPELSSWVPDLTARCDRHRIRELIKLHVWDLHDACAGRLVEMVETPDCDAPGLTLAGILIDKIAKVGAACLDLNPLSPPPEYPIPIFQPNRQWWELVENSWTSHTSPSVRLETRKAFMRVLTRDCVEEVAPPHFQVTWRRILPPEVKVCLREVEISRSQKRTYFKTKMINYRFFITEGGLLGMGPAETSVGDAIFVLYGGRLPFVLRPCSASWTFMGDAFVDGIMDGQAVSGGKKEWVTII